MTIDIGKIVKMLCDQNEICQRENNALRMLLHKQGLSDADIDRMVAQNLDQTKSFENALQLLTQVCEQMLEHLHGCDVEAALLASATGSKPSAFQAESFQHLCWIMVRWSSTGRIHTRFGM